MKSFLTFLSEATQSQASQQAQKLGLKGDGHGGWLDRSGKVVARTDKGKLKFIDGRQAGAAEPAAAPRQAGPAPTPQPQAAQAPAPVPQQAPGDRKSTRLNSSHVSESRMPSSA